MLHAFNINIQAHSIKKDRLKLTFKQFTKFSTYTKTISLCLKYYTQLNEMEGKKNPYIDTFTDVVNVLTTTKLTFQGSRLPHAGCFLWNAQCLKLVLTYVLIQQ
ncbi:hypothetical protein KIL84_013917 [Mauremys mutica]|uniref:Uncharacterized protein n=1 Tax=Mauremys mutica TaxID=74926 RepID=A0A9D3WWB5_9SAUR|nr:hypothetical protein KIL84_013917 [Mauremys mutica]